VAGLINYFPLEIVGKRSIVAGVIDFMAVDELPGSQAVDLVRTALADMTRRGVHLALALRIYGMSWWPLARASFTIQPRDYCYIAQPINFDQPDWQLRKLHVHWR
ncbi:MAG: hypothetical protein K8T25_14515, partial [Planctomycetia bacterium]|nr:hypothetical protein [Planctomycetia bacterium]